jgi:pimeloyl-ACP methyl ester carboxylesterase
VEELGEERQVVMIGHSLGSVIAGRVAMELGTKCLALVLLCPKAEISEKERKGTRLLTRMPQFLVDYLRLRDRTYPRERDSLI